MSVLLFLQLPNTTHVNVLYLKHCCCQCFIGKLCAVPANDVWLFATLDTHCVCDENYPHFLLSEAVWHQVTVVVGC